MPETAPGAPPTPPPGTAPPHFEPSAPPTGLSRRAGAFLSYLAGWVTGIVMLFVSRDPVVRYHAARSVVFFGSVAVIQVALSVLSGLHLIAPLTVAAGVLLGIFSFVVWILCLVRSWTRDGERFRIPLVGDLVDEYAERLVAAA